MSQALVGPTQAAFDIKSTEVIDSNQAALPADELNSEFDCASDQRSGILSLVRFLKSRRPHKVNSDWRSEMPRDGGEWKSETEARETQNHFASEGGKPLPCLGGRQPKVRTWKRRNSQIGFAMRSQSVIILDWDDTLFPTSCLRDELGLLFNVPLDSQQLSQERKQQIAEKLARCEQEAVHVLTTSHSHAHVVIVTLAAQNWVSQCCRQWYPCVGETLAKLNVEVACAQDYVSNKCLPPDPCDEVALKFWGVAKGRAIAVVLDRFYSQYDGQSWKNVLSIGDSPFEMYGLLAAASSYVSGSQIDDNLGVWSANRREVWQRVDKGHVLHLRTKCCKLLDAPSLDELTAQLQALEQWLIPMVKLDDGFHIELDCIDSEEMARLVEDVLRGEIPTSELPVVHFNDTAALCH